MNDQGRRRRRNRVGRGVTAAALGLALSGAPAIAEFSPPRNVSDTPGASLNASVALEGNLTQYVVWADNTTDEGGIGASFRLRYAAFSPGGPAGPSELVPGVVSFDESLLPRAVVDVGGTLHVVFQNRVASRYDVFHTSFNGVGWSPLVNVSESPGDSVSPAVAVDGSGQLHVVWADDSDVSGAAEIFYAKRNGLGVFSAPQNISQQEGTVSAFPDVAVTADDLPNVVFLNTSSGVTSVFFARGTAGGAFSTPKNISKELFTGPIGDSGPAIAAGGSGDRLHVVWAGFDDADGSDVFYQSASTSTLRFSRPRNLSNRSGVSKAPRVAADGGGQVHVVWADNSFDPEYDVLYYRIFPNGAGDGPILLDRTPGRSLFPDVKVDLFDEQRICWQDDDASVPAANFEILCVDGTESIGPVTTATIDPAPDPSCGSFIRSEPVTVTLASTDNSGSVREITIVEDGHNPRTATESYGTCPTTGPFETSFAHPGQGSHTIRFFATDCDGNVEPQKSVSFKVDALPPNTSAMLAGSCGEGCPVYDGPVEVTLAAADQGPAGVSRTVYALDGGPETPYGGPFTVSSEGVHTVTFRSDDRACNSESPKAISFEIRGGLRVDIVSPQSGGIYYTNQQTVAVPAPPDQTVAVGQNRVTVGATPVYTGTAQKPRVTVEARITSADGAPIEFAQVCIHTEPNLPCKANEIVAADNVDRPSGSTYKFRFKIVAPVANRLQFWRVEAADKRTPPTPVRKGADEIGVIVTE